MLRGGTLALSSCSWWLLLYGAALDPNAFIVGRSLPVSVGNGIYLDVMTLLSAKTNEQERPMYFGLW